MTKAEAMAKALGTAALVLQGAFGGAELWPDLSDADHGMAKRCWMEIVEGLFERARKAEIAAGKGSRA